MKIFNNIAINVCQKWDQNVNGVETYRPIPILASKIKKLY